jgi:hypothetical protein
MARNYYWCDFPTNDAGGKCMKPATSHGVLRWCAAHAARLPYWPTDAEPAGTPSPNEAGEAR